MGRAEHLKLERKLIEAQQKAVSVSTQDKRNTFLTGFGAGVVVTAILAAVLFSMKSNIVQPAAQLPSLATGSAQVKDVTVPNNLALPQGSAGSLPLSIQP